MIQLDTSFLVRSLVRGSAEDHALRRWLKSDGIIGISAIAWTEFLCGPVTAAVIEAAAELLGEPVPFEAPDAAIAAELYNAGGRKRGTLVDSMIAAIAMRSGARLATANPADFRRLASSGLVLAT